MSTLRMVVWGVRAYAAGVVKGNREQANVQDRAVEVLGVLLKVKRCTVTQRQREGEEVVVEGVGEGEVEARLKGRGRVPIAARCVLAYSRVFYGFLFNYRKKKNGQNEKTKAHSLASYRTILTYLLPIRHCPRGQNQAAT